MRHLIEVTKQDIKNGVPCNPWCCPIANAVCRHFKIKNDNSSPVSVASNVRVKGDVDTYYKLSRAANRFIDRFDKGHKVAPFKFYITEINSKFYITEIN